MTFKEYSNPQEVGWKGWVENANGDCIAFVKLDGKFVFEW